VLSLQQLLARLTHGPAEALRLPVGQLTPGSAADVVLFDPAASTLAGEHWYSRGQNCPFLGHCLPGSVRYTWVDGRLAHQG
jgi:dihydroorotase